MKHLRIWLGLAILAGTGIGDETKESDGAAAPAGGETREIVVDLAVGAPTKEARLGYSSPRRMAVELTVPRFLFEVPKFHAKNPAFFRVALGESEGVPFYGAIDKSPESTYHNLLYLDKNRDLDLTNDGPPIKARIRTLWTNESKLIEFLGVSLALPYKIDGKAQTEPYPCVFYFVLPGAKAVPPKDVMVERDGWRETELELGGEKYRLVVVDDDSDGQFSTGDSWSFGPSKLDKLVLLGRDATRKMVFPSWTADQKWTVEVKGIDAAGRKLTLEVGPAKETEREYFLKIYKARQNPAERRRNIDPMRPKIGKGKEVDWIMGKDVKYALEIAERDQTPGRVLVEFMARTCPHCRDMNVMTMRDREVHSLSQRFVCSRIEFKRGNGDSDKYKVDVTPTYVILDKTGAEIARHVGFLRPTEFAAWLKAALR